MVERVRSIRWQLLESFMKTTFLRWCVVFVACGLAGAWSGSATPAPNTADPMAWPDGLPVYDHVVIVVEENKDYEQIIDNANAPYINLTLRKEGATLTRMFGEEHNSQGNYFWLFSGSNQNVGFKDEIPTKDNNPNYPFTGPNLGAALITKGLSFKGHSEDLPAVGNKDEFGPNADGEKSYARKHNPWVSFQNVPNDDPATSSNLRFVDFPSDPAKFDSLPRVAFVIPGLKHDMHDDEPEVSIPRGDAWLKKNLDAYYQWAKTHNSLLIVTWDENDDKKQDPTTGVNVKYQGLTNPFVEPTNQRNRNIQNRIATFIAGARVKHGDFAEGKGVTHVNILRTLEAMYGLSRAGAQQPKAAAGGIQDDYIITDLFDKTE
jgi:acid phosphatase